MAAAANFASLNVGSGAVRALLTSSGLDEHGRSVPELTERQIELLHRNPDGAGSSPPHASQFDDV